jgi:N-acetylneuraminic acid mutarotase
MEPEFAPSGRIGHKMVYDWDSDKIILFGGFKGKSSDDPYLSDTWAYDVNEDYWEELSPRSSPSPRIYHGMAYDMDTDRVVMWGGRPYKEVNDTTVWIYDYNTDSWESRKCKNSPSKRLSYHGMLYYPPWEKVVLFGGVALSGRLKGTLSNQTWTLDLQTNSWERLKQSSPPSPRAKHAMVYARRDNKLVVFGGCVTKICDDNYITDQLWIFDANNSFWLNLSR